MSNQKESKLSAWDKRIHKKLAIHPESNWKTKKASYDIDDDEGSIMGMDKAVQKAYNKAEEPSAGSSGKPANLTIVQ